MNHQNLEDLDLRKAFPEMPQDIYQSLMRTAASVREDSAAARPRYRTALLAAVILVSMAAVAFAVFPSQLTEFFGRIYGRQTQEWLEQGSLATPQDRLSLAGLEFTMEEVVYHNQGLYGLVRVTGEQADHASVRIEKIGADGKNLLAPLRPVGLSEEKQEDGSLLFSFEVADGSVIGQAENYTLLLTAGVGEQRAEWLVQVAPQKLSAASDTQTNEEPIAENPDQVKPELIVPETYKKTGTLPIYAAIPRDFGAGLKPELFNRSGIARRDKYAIIYNDEAVLQFSPEAIYYCEHKGTYNGNYKKPDMTPMPLPLGTLDQAAAELASNVYSGWPNFGKDWEGVTLEKTALRGITLKEAQDQLETLLTALRVEGYHMTWALDMDLARIQSLGAIMNDLHANSAVWNSPMYDYSQATAENEGYYLVYENGLKSSEGLFGVYAYVTGKGITHLVLQDKYIRGEIVAAPEKLLSPEAVLVRLPREMARSRFSDLTLLSVRSMELTWAPVRVADQGEGMVMMPAWYITYRDSGSLEKGPYDAYAVFNAVDGSLISAIFQ